MRFSFPTSASWLLVGSLLAYAVAIPVPHDDNLQVHDTDTPNPSIPEVAYWTRSPEDNSPPTVLRRIPKPKPKTKPKSKTPTTKKPKTPEKPKATPKVKTPPGKKPPTKPKKPKKGKQEQWQGPVPSEAEIDKKCRVPKDHALFWSGTSPKVHTYNAKAGLTTDSQAYPNGYTWRFRGKDAAKSALFAERFSRVFAKKASGVVHLMVPWAKGPRPDRVFQKDEWPILKKSLKSGRVTKIVQVNPDNFQETRTYDPKTYGLTKRADEIDLGNVPWDVDLDALAEAWKRADEGM
jgi:hypothetical protein